MVVKKLWSAFSARRSLGVCAEAPRAIDVGRAVRIVSAGPILRYVPEGALQWLFGYDIRLIPIAPDRFDVVEVIDGIFAAMARVVAIATALILPVAVVRQTPDSVLPALGFVLAVGLALWLLKLVTVWHAQLAFRAFRRGVLNAVMKSG